MNKNRKGEILPELTSLESHVMDAVIYAMFADAQELLDACKTEPYVENRIAHLALTTLDSVLDSLVVKGYIESKFKKGYV